MNDSPGTTIRYEQPIEPLRTKPGRLCSIPTRMTAGEAVARTWQPAELHYYMLTYGPPAPGRMVRVTGDA